MYSFQLFYPWFLGVRKNKKKNTSRSNVAKNPHMLVTAAIESNMGQLVMSQMREVMNVRRP
jgi:hypothetical protein